jgi:hypothetical protein
MLFLILKIIFMKHIFTTIALVLSCISMSYAQEKSPREIQIDKSKERILKEVEGIKKSVDTSKVREMANILRNTADEISTPLYDQAYMLDNYADSLGIDMPVLDSIYNDDDAVPEETVNPDQGVVAEDGTGGFDLDKFNKNLEKAERKAKVAITAHYGFVSAIAGKAANESLRPTYQFGTGYHYELNYSMRRMFHKKGDTKYYSRIGLSYDFHNLEQKTFFRFKKVDGKAVPENINPDGTDDADLNFYSVNMPISLDVKLKKGNMVCVGPYIGYVFSLNQTYSYNDGDYYNQNKIVGNYGANRVRYGLKFEYITRKFLGFYFQFDANNITKGAAAKANMYSIGLMMGK